MIRLIWIYVIPDEKHRLNSDDPHSMNTKEYILFASIILKISCIQIRFVLLHALTFLILRESTSESSKKI